MAWHVAWHVAWQVPFEGLTMVHLDAHPDLSASTTMPAQLIMEEPYQVRNAGNFWLKLSSDAKWCQVMSSVVSQEVHHIAPTFARLMLHFGMILGALPNGFCLLHTQDI